MIPSRRRPDRPPTFRIGGFPIRVRPGFLLFVAVIVVTNQGPVGWWLAIALTLLTLTHELGHAFAARHYGAEAEIALDFVAGYTSFSPSRPLGNGDRAVIAVAGPLAEIIPGLAVLLALGANPLSIDSIHESPIRQAFWWAGPVLGLVNLLPVIPLDGGTLIASALDAAAPGRGRRLALWWSVVITIGASVILVTITNGPPLLVFMAFLFALQIQQLLADRRRAQRKPQAIHTVVRALLDEGYPLEAAREGARRFEMIREPGLAVLVARAAARIGEHQTALAWIQAAAHSADDPEEVLADFDLETDFDTVRDTPAGQAMRRALVSRV